MLQLLHMLDKWSEYLECGGQIDAVYTDFEKAFDKVPHKRLLSKLHSYEISDSIINWIKDFLASRKYRVKVNGSYSSWAEVTSGIPQSSVWVHFFSWYILTISLTDVNRIQMFIYSQMMLRYSVTYYVLMTNRDYKV